MKSKHFKWFSICRKSVTLVGVTFVTLLGLEPACLTIHCSDVFSMFVTLLGLEPQVASVSK